MSATTELWRMLQDAGISFSVIEEGDPMADLYSMEKSTFWDIPGTEISIVFIEDGCGFSKLEAYNATPQQAMAATLAACGDEGE